MDQEYFLDEWWMNVWTNERSNERTIGRQRPLEWEGLLWGLLGSVNTICMSRPNIYELFKEIKWNSYLLRLSFVFSGNEIFLCRKIHLDGIFHFSIFSEMIFFVGRGLDNDDTFPYTVNTYNFLKFCLHNLVNI